MIQVRKDNPSLVYADFEDLDPSNAQVYAFKRWDESSTYLVALNFSSDRINYNLDCAGYDKVIGNYDTGLSYQNGQITLDPWEAVLLKKEKA